MKKLTKQQRRFLDLQTKSPKPYLFEWLMRCPRNGRLVAAKGSPENRTAFRITANSHI